MFLINSICGQQDNEFWFAAPDLQEIHGDDPILLRISTGNEPANITILQPANPDFSPINIQLSAFSSKSVDLTPFKSIIECDKINQKQNKGLLIKSNCFINCYYDIANQYNGDLFALKGQNALGTKFTIPFQMSFNSGSGYGYPRYTANIIVVASEDSTEIIINPRKDIFGFQAGNLIKVLLNKGETYSVQSISTYSNERAGGTIVKANKPIAITLKDDSIQLPGYGCADTAGDQLIPDEIAGNEFILIKGRLYTSDKFFIYAIKDSTSIYIKGKFVAFLNIGEYYEGSLEESAVHITTTSPCQVFQISGFGCEIGGAVIPSIQCTGSNSVNITRATSQDFFLNLVAPKDAIDGFTLNGKDLGISKTDFYPVFGTDSAWWFSRINISIELVPEGGLANISNNSGRFHLGIIHGDQGSTSRFGYFSDFSNSEISFSNHLVNLCSSSLSYCSGAAISITGYEKDATKYYWQGPNGFYLEGQRLEIENFSKNLEGYYTIYSEGGSCGTSFKRILLSTPERNPVQALMHIDSFSKCDDNNLVKFKNLSYTADGTSIIRSVWSIGERNFENIDSLNYEFPDPGKFKIKILVVNENNCRDSLENEIEILRSPNITINAESKPRFCLGDSVVLKCLIAQNNIDSIKLEWYKDNILIKNEDKLEYVAFESGRYKVAAISSNGCRKESSEISVDVLQNPTITLLFPESQIICGNNGIRLAAQGNGNLQWYFNGNPISGANSIFYDANNAGVYSLSSTSPNGCKIWADTSVALTKKNLPTPKFIFQDGCVGKEVSFNNITSNFDSDNLWNWDLGDGSFSQSFSPVHVYKVPGKYQVTLEVRSRECPTLIGKTTKSILVNKPNPGIRYPVIRALKDYPTLLRSRNFGNVAWIPSIYLDNPNNDQPTFQSSDNQSYEVHITTAEGCITIDTQEVLVFEQSTVFVPSAFTPNNDGNNDELQFFLQGVRTLEIFQVFSRWGQLLFETSTPGVFWDGTFQNIQQPIDTYVWIARGVSTDGKSFNIRGQTALIR